MSLSVPKPKFISVYALTIAAVSLFVFGVGYAVSCDSDARTRGHFDGACWHTGAALALGGGTTAAGTWRLNPYIRKKEENPSAEVDRAPILHKLDELEDEIIALRSAVDTALKLAKLEK